MLKVFASETDSLLAHNRATPDKIEHYKAARQNAAGQKKNPRAG
jgi:hypothetical protein